MILIAARILENTSHPNHENRNHGKAHYRIIINGTAIESRHGLLADSDFYAEKCPGN